MKSVLTSILAAAGFIIIQSTVSMYPIKILWNWFAYNFNFVQITLGQAWLGAFLVTLATLPIKNRVKTNIE